MHNIWFVILCISSVGIALIWCDSSSGEFNEKRRNFTVSNPDVISDDYVDYTIDEENVEKLNTSLISVKERGKCTQMIIKHYILF